MQPLSDEEASSPRVVLLLVLSVTMVSSASILIRFSISPPLVIVFWRTLYGSIVMATLGLVRGDHTAYRGKQMKRTWGWLVLIGIVLSLHFSTWFTSLFMTTVAASVVLVNASPIFTAILSTLVLGEALRRRSWIGVGVAVTGAILLAWNDLSSVGAGALTGDLLALLSALFLAIYFIGGRRYAKGLPITVYTSVIYLVAAAATLPLCVTLGLDVLVFDTREILIFIALAIFPTALGHSVNNYLLTLVPAYVVSSAVLGEPIGATLLAAVFLQEVPVPLTFLGFGVILVGIALVLADIASKERSSRLPLDDSNGA
ncbi:MAG: EamA family transporter [Candidatus Thorarchaeota archaeon]|nr:MAG: EamA family transporter [Candidatus Thorarchaeota archaeon]